eukprot:PhM_4_TR6024/c0_g1_i1/m.93585
MYRWTGGSRAIARLRQQREQVNARRRDDISKQPPEQDHGPHSHHTTESRRRIVDTYRRQHHLKKRSRDIDGEASASCAFDGGRTLTRRSRRGTVDLAVLDIAPTPITGQHGDFVPKLGDDSAAPRKLAPITYLHGARGGRSCAAPTRLSIDGLPRRAPEGILSHTTTGGTVGSGLSWAPPCSHPGAFPTSFLVPTPTPICGFSLFAHSASHPSMFSLEFPESGAMPTMGFTPENGGGVAVPEATLFLGQSAPCGDVVMVEGCGALCASPPCPPHEELLDSDDPIGVGYDVGDAEWYGDTRQMRSEVCESTFGHRGDLDASFLE